MQSVYGVFLLALSTLLVTQARGDIILSSQGNGADAYVNQASPDGNQGTASLFVQGTAGSGRKIYVRFDISSLNPADLVSATLKLTFSVSRNLQFTVDLFGLRNGFPGVDGTNPPNGSTKNEFDIHDEDWPELTGPQTTPGSNRIAGIDWDSAPANNLDDASLLTADAISLDSKSFASSTANTTLSFSDVRLLNFLKNDTNGLVTFILTTPTQVSDQQFYSRETDIVAFRPTLEFEVQASPEPSGLVLGGFGLAGLLVAMRRSRNAKLNPSASPI